MSTLSIDSIYKHVSFLGGGNMAEAVLAGLLRAGHPTTRITVAEVVPERAHYLHHTYHIPVTGDCCIATKKADLIVLAVKPLQCPNVLRSIASQVRANRALLLSVAAGVRVNDMCRWLGADAEYSPKVVRCMPNTPALVASGAAGVFAGNGVTEDGKKSAEEVLRAVSQTICWVEDEKLLDPVTAVSGSGPAYFFLLMECIADAGVEAGLSREVSNQLTIQTCLGAAKMAQMTNDSFSELRRKVTSPNGTTYAALMHMEKHNVSDILKTAVLRASERSTELGDELSASNK